MKFCLSSRQQAEYLHKADEIKFYYRDRKAIPDFFEKYPTATIILVHSNHDDEINWNEISNYNILSQEKFIICVDTIDDCIAAKAQNIPFYHNAGVKTAYELRALKELGVCYALIDAPLFFNMDLVKSIDVPVRAVPNLALKDGLPRDNGIVGTWIRPEDLGIYEDYIAAIEFEDFTEDREKYYQKERAMFRIYAEQKHWPGNLNMLVTGLNFSALNRVINPVLSERRMTCRQKCEEGGHCRLCYHVLSAANQESIEQYRDEISAN